MKAWRFVISALFLTAGAGLAKAQSVSPAQIQAQIAGGNTGLALQELQTAVQVHPDSGVAWYLMAEAQDAAGNEAAARAALAKAEQFAPGLPFASQQDVAALQAHLSTHGAGAMLMVILGLVVLFVVIRMFLRVLRPMGMGYGRPAYEAPPQYPYGAGYAPGGGVGSSLLTGLAAGAGFAAGERIIDDLTGQNQYPDQSFNQDLPRDDGLQGNPGWDDSSDDNFDPGNNW